MQRPAKPADASIVHQDVDSPKQTFDPPGRRLNRLQTGHVTRNDLGFPARPRD